MHQNSPPPPDPAVPLQDPVSTLPQHVAGTVLLKAGLQMRLVSRTYRALHPPLLALAPHSTTGAALQAALPSLPSTLTSLDLRGMRSLTPATLAAIPAALPHLQQLLLPRLMGGELYLAALRALQACPHLHTLLPSAASAHGNSLHPTCWAILQEPPTASRLRSLTLPAMMLDTPLATPLPPFPHLTHLRLGEDSRRINPDHALLHLMTAAPSLCFLKAVDSSWSCGAGWLSAFTGLSKLSFKGTFVDSGEVQPMGVRLHQFGALTALRSLALHLDSHSGWTPAEAGWLSRLTLLTNLDIHFAAVCGDGNVEGYISEEEEEGNQPPSRIGAVVTEVAASLSQLPALQRLRLSVCDFSDGEERLGLTEAQLARGQPGSVFARLAAATQLHHLALEYLPLPTADTRVLASLQGLTSLHLRPYTAQFDDLRWVSALTCLQQFRWENDNGQEGLPLMWQAVATLPRLHTLAMRLWFNAAALQQPLADLLLALQGRLERLQLAGKVGRVLLDTGPSSMLARLRGMQCLRVLDLRDLLWEGGWEELLGWLPRSLRQCYLPRSLWHGAGSVQELQAAWPWVVLRLHERLDEDVW